MTEKEKASALADVNEASEVIASTAPETQSVLRALLKGVIAGAHIAEQCAGRVQGDD